MITEDFNEVLKITKNSVFILNEATKSYCNTLIHMIRQVNDNNDTEMNQFLYDLNTILSSIAKNVIGNTSRLLDIYTDHNFTKEEIQKIIIKELENFSGLFIQHSNENNKNTMSEKLNMKDEFLLKKVLVTDTKKQYSSIAKLQEENQANPLPGLIDDCLSKRKAFKENKHDCEYEVEGHCMLNTPKADIDICDNSSKKDCSTYKKFAQ
jgi:hypothetical protein